MEVLADDYASKGDEELIEVKVGDDLIFIEKKFIKLGSSALEPSTETPPQQDELLGEDEEEEDEISINDLDDEDEDDEDDEDDEISIDDLDDEDEDDEEKTDDEPASVTPSGPTDLEMLRAKLKKSLSELEEIKSDMQTTFTSTDTISSTIQSLRGMIDAMRKDQMNILSNR